MAHRFQLPETLSPQTNSLATIAPSIQDSSTHQTNRYGGIGGEFIPPLMFSGYITQIRTYAELVKNKDDKDVYILRSIQFSFADGKETTFGMPIPQLIPPFGRDATLDLRQDSIAAMYILTVTDSTIFKNSVENIGCGAIYIETLRNRELSIHPDYNPMKVTPLSRNGEWQLVSQKDSPCRNFFLVGAMGHASTKERLVYNLAFYFQKDTLRYRAADNFLYNIENPSTDAQMVSIAVASAANTTEQEQSMSIKFDEAVSSTYTWNVETGLSIGAEAKLTAGIPGVVQGETTISTTLSFVYSWGEEKSMSSAFGYEATVTVPANSSIVATAFAEKSQIKGTFTATLTEFWEHAGKIPQEIRGSVEGVSAYNVQVTYETGKLSGARTAQHSRAA